MYWYSIIQSIFNSLVIPSICTLLLCFALLWFGLVMAFANALSLSLKHEWYNKVKTSKMSQWRIPIAFMELFWVQVEYIDRVKCVCLLWHLCLLLVKLEVDLEWKKNSCWILYFLIESWFVPWDPVNANTSVWWTTVCICLFDSG